jgi:large subunit ribosomal protein L23
MNQSGKHKQMTVRSGGRTIRTTGKRSDYKKAVITLESGSTIDLLRGETAN